MPGLRGLYGLQYDLEFGIAALCSMQDYAFNYFKACPILSILDIEKSLYCIGLPCIGIVNAFINFYIVFSVFSITGRL